MSRKIILPAPLKHQIPILNDQHRFKVIVAGRRWGKTVLGLICVVGGHGSGAKKFKGAAQGARIWWVAPTYGIANLIWRDLKWALQDAWVEKREDEKYIELPGGGSVTVKSADNPDALRGIGLDGIVIDEAAYVSEDAWNQALRPTLADRQGWALFISTPAFEKKKGDSWFRQLYLDGLNNTDQWACWQRPSSDNEKIPAEEIAEARKNIPEQAFRQEFMAEFVDMSGGIFKREWFKRYKENNEYYVLDKASSGPQMVKKFDCLRFCTVDLATSSKESADYTVVATWAITPDRDLLLLDITRGRYEAQHHAQKIWDAFQKHSPAYIGVEKVAFQGNLLQTLAYGGSLVNDWDGNGIIIPPLPIFPLKADRDKQSRAMVVAHHYMAGKVYHPDSNPFWLRDYESELVAFPMGDHDDQVDCAGYAGIELSKPSLITGTNLPIYVMGGGVRK